MLETLKALSPALVAAAASFAVVLLTFSWNRKLTYFQTYSNKKLDAYSSFCESMVRYDRTGSTEDEIAMIAALHIACLLAPIPLYAKMLETASGLRRTSHLSGDQVMNLIDMMRLGLDHCRRLKFSKMEPVDKTVSIKR